MTGSSVAMPVGRGSIEAFHAPTDLTATLISNGAGSWQYGQLYVDLAAKAGHSVAIVGIVPHVLRRDLAPPAWIYIPEGGCGPNVGDRTFAFDLDKPSLKDDGLAPAPPGNTPTDAPTAALGPGFVLSGSKHARIRIDALSCEGNYEWSIGIQYTVTGEPGIRTENLGPFDSYGLADNTVEYTGGQDATGTVQISSQKHVTGPASSLKCQP